MGVKAKKALKLSLKKKASQLSASKTINKKPINEQIIGDTKNRVSADFLPLEGGPARKLPDQKPVENTATVLYLGRIPHGFYEEEMKAYFKQFGKVKRLRIARNKTTGHSKHYGFIEFESPEVAKIVAEAMHNQLLFEHMLQVHVIPTERVHPKLWKNGKLRKQLDWVGIERRRHNKDRTAEEQNKLVQRILQRDQKRRRKIQAAGIDYECPEIVGSIQPVSKKIKFDED